MNVTPSAFGQRLKTGKFTKEELQRIAAILDAEYIFFSNLKMAKKYSRIFCFFLLEMKCRKT